MIREKSPSRLDPVAFNDVHFTDTFWAPRIKLVHEQTIPFEYQQCKETGRIDALRLDWKPGQEPEPHIFWESDVAKWLEAASYSLAVHPDPDLDGLVDQVVALLAGAQQPDGYLNVYFTVVEPGRRWTDLRDAHELYCAGHLIEAGVAHFQATGKRQLLNVVRRYADYIATVFGREPDKKQGYGGHEEIELALVKLYRVTGDEKYLRLSQYFVDERGRQPYYFEQEAQERGTPGFFGTIFPERDQEQAKSREYNQSHLPVREQTEAVGHAVRAMYLYCAMADLAREVGDESLAQACERLWQHLTTKRMYLTGGIGSSLSNEGFTSDYDLPNEAAYAETCAAVGLVFWAHRMLHLECDGRYADVLERTLYNGVLSGISLDGKKFFYVNPLASSGNAHRYEWFGCACCPPNIARLLASLGQYVYSQGPSDLVVHLYASGQAQLQVGGQALTIQQSTQYPWDGAVRLAIEQLAEPSAFTVKLRIPGWCREPAVRMNGMEVDVAANLEKGYVAIERTWQASDVIELDLPMDIQRMYAHPAVAADRSCTALQRGPIVYCLEGVDHASASLGELELPLSQPLQATFHPDLLDGVVALHGMALVPNQAAWDGLLYTTSLPQMQETPLTAIPYYAWDNREPGEMRVWIREQRPSL
ncbi:glycoside hydrolase family 127 protein [Dictyobacter aurantiacus]|uniref:Glycoside hydrolase family 127 protein n=1 Tax=Dictyobacter aurantiacus TaxID=1936993 RepID=A0A401ZS43_9CHLR|nr:beta-L-arabinofuranosidase domain-containing protein [Dictyobacter aurantiacus]GCE09709.1 hypothetical protein KDAU_70380 [Dictyobacter aurantiacus]